MTPKTPEHSPFDDQLDSSIEQFEANELSINIDIDLDLNESIISEQGTQTHAEEPSISAEDDDSSSSSSESPISIEDSKIHESPDQAAPEPPSEGLSFTSEKENLAGFTILDNLSQIEGKNDDLENEQNQNDIDQATLSGLYQLNGTQDKPAEGVTSSSPSSSIIDSPDALSDVSIDIQEPLSEVGLNPNLAPHDNMSEENEKAMDSPPIADLSDQVSMMNNLEDITADHAASSNEAFALTNISTSTSVQPMQQYDLAGDSPDSSTEPKQFSESTEASSSANTSNTEASSENKKSDDDSDEIYDILSSLEEQTSARLVDSTQNESKNTSTSSFSSSSTYVGGVDHSTSSQGTNSEHMRLLTADGIAAQSPQMQKISPQKDLASQAASFFKKSNTLDRLKPMLGVIIAVVLLFVAYKNIQPIRDFLFQISSSQNIDSLSDSSSDSSYDESSQDEDEEDYEEDTDEYDETTTSDYASSDSDTSPYVEGSAVSWGVISTSQNNPYAQLKITIQDMSLPEDDVYHERYPLHPWAYGHISHPFSPHPKIAALGLVDTFARQWHSSASFSDQDSESDDPQPFNPSEPDFITSDSKPSQPIISSSSPSITQDQPVTSVTHEWSQDDFDQRLNSEHPYKRYEVVFYIRHHRMDEKIPTLREFISDDQKPWLILYSLSALFDLNASISIEDVEESIENIPKNIIKKWVKKFRNNHPTTHGDLSVMRAMIRSSPARVRREILKTLYRNLDKDDSGLSVEYILAGIDDPNPYIRKDSLRMQSSL